MTSWGYLILIVALLGLAGVMLYARFASRSREKSLHHAPVDWVFPDGVISGAEREEEAKPEADGEVAITLKEDAAAQEAADTKKIEGSEGTDGVQVLAEPVLRVGQNAPESNASPVDRRERDYIDELQEAAAGLAMLMRSSPVSRPQPVVFAPEETSSHAALPEEVAVMPCGEEQDEANVNEEEGAIVLIEGDEMPDLAVAELVAGEAESVESNGLVAEGVEVVIVSAEEEAPLVIESDLIVEEELASSFSSQPSLEPRSLGEILGEAVLEQLGRIDEDLDALESLVLGIESSLRALHDLDRNEIDLAPGGTGDLVAA
ncbi:MAG: hypothetical protein KDN18_21485 [Verrucomicrobiae bacterium]|nr:hypothetical protein [Verrucomicrobiae bacterium]